MVKNKLKLGLPLQLLTIVLFVLFLGDSVPLGLKSFFYALSLSLKEVLLFALPFIIFSFLFSSLISFKDGALRLILSLFGGVFVSCFLASFFAYGASLALLSPSTTALPQGPVLILPLEPLWSFSLPQILSNQYALLGGAFLGVLFSYSRPPLLLKWSQRMKGWSLGFLKTVFIPFVPVFVFGFLIKLDHEDLLIGAIKTYGPIAALLVGIKVIYIGSLLGLASKGRWQRFCELVKNIFPSVLSGFSTMSSAATLPITLEGAEANTKDPILAEVVVPATVNIHLLGDCIGIPFLAMATLLAFGESLPGLEGYFTFAIYFVISRFAIVAVPGGCVFILLPLIETYLGFNGEMSSLLATFTILFDPIFTAVNVAGNGAFAVLFIQLYHKLFPKRHPKTPTKLRY